MPGEVLLGLRLCQGWFRLDIRENLFPERVASLEQAAQGMLESLEMFRTRLVCGLVVALALLGCGGAPCVCRNQISCFCLPGFLLCSPMFCCGMFSVGQTSTRRADLGVESTSRVSPVDISVPELQHDFRAAFPAL